MIYFLTGAYTTDYRWLAIALVDEKDRCFFSLNNEASSADFPASVRSFLPRDKDPSDIRSLAWRSSKNLNIDIAAYLYRGCLDYSKMRSPQYSQLFQNNNYLLWQSPQKINIEIVTNDENLLLVLRKIFDKDFPTWFPSKISLVETAFKLDKGFLAIARLLSSKYYLNGTIRKQSSKHLTDETFNSF